MIFSDIIKYISPQCDSNTYNTNTIILNVCDENAAQTLTRHTSCRVGRWDAVGAVAAWQERKRGLQALCLLHGPTMGVLQRSSTMAGHEVLLIQHHLLSETVRPDPWRVGGLHLSRVCRGDEVRSGGNMIGCSGFHMVPTLRGPPLVGCCSLSLTIAVLILRPVAGLCVSTALFARRRPGQVQTGGRHALIHLDRSTMMRARSCQQERSEKTALRGVVWLDRFMTAEEVSLLTIKRLHFVAEEMCLSALGKRKWK